jgi:hypothetical protein
MQRSSSYNAWWATSGQSFVIKEAHDEEVWMEVLVRMWGEEKRFLMQECPINPAGKLFLKVFYGRETWSTQSWVGSTHPHVYSWTPSGIWVCQRVVKMVVKHITNTEYYPAYEQLLNKIEVARIAKRAVVNGNLLESEEVDREDWEQRNYQDDWLAPVLWCSVFEVGRLLERKDIWV